MPEDGFKPHTTNSRPVPRSVGAIVTLRNGEKAVVSPYPPGEKYRFSTVWFQLGQEDDDKGEDIVSYRLLSPSDADRLLWDVFDLKTYEGRNAPTNAVSNRKLSQRVAHHT